MNDATYPGYNIGIYQYSTTATASKTTISTDSCFKFCGSSQNYIGISSTINQGCKCGSYPTTSELAPWTLGDSTTSDYRGSGLYFLVYEILCM